MVGNKAKPSVVLVILTILFALALPSGAGEIAWRGKVQTDYLGFRLAGAPFTEQVLGIYQAVAEDAVSVALSVQYHREKNSRYALALVNVPREESLLLIPSYTAQPAEGLELRVYGLKEFAATEATAFGAGLSYKF